MSHTNYERGQLRKVLIYQKCVAAQWHCYHSYIYSFLLPIFLFASEGTRPMANKFQQGD